MVQWTSVITDRTAVAVRVVAITGATTTAALAAPRVAFALGSAQAAAYLLARLIQRPAVLDPLLSVAALFAAPFTPAFLIVPIVALVVYLRTQTSLFTASDNTREIMTTIRTLSGEGSLDPVAIARSLLEELQRICPYQAATITVGSRILAAQGVMATRDEVIPLVVGDQSIGELAFTGITLAPPAKALVTEGIAKIETALLFTEARTAASAAERSRLARDMHDGIAQELTAVGYLIDELLVDAPESQRATLRSLRNELTRVIADLRISIFELRSATTDTLSLGTALSDYINQIREAAPFKIHLNIDDGAERLSENVEQELLRIVQEALANARRHSRAANLWISAQIRAPRALITVDDDGIGLQPGRSDSFGMSIMVERATQIGATVTLSNRRDGGTTVTVEVGG